MTPIILNYNSSNNNKCRAAANGKCWFSKVPASERLFQTRMLSSFSPFEEVSKEKRTLRFSFVSAVLFNISPALKHLAQQSQLFKINQVL